MTETLLQIENNSVFLAALQRSNTQLINLHFFVDMNFYDRVSGLNSFLKMIFFVVCRVYQ